MSNRIALWWTILGAFWMWFGLWLRKKGHPILGWIAIIIGALNLMGVGAWFIGGVDMTKPDFGAADKAA